MFAAAALGVIGVAIAPLGSLTAATNPPTPEVAARYLGPQQLVDVGAIPMIFSAAEFGAFVAAEAEKWSKVVKFAGIKPE